MIKWELKKFLVKDLKEYSKNPRKLSKNDYEHLSTSVSKFGLIDKPVCLKNGQLIGGHQRKKILEKLAIKEVECWVPDQDLTDKDFEELNIRLNRNQGTFDDDILANEYDQLDLLNWGFDANDMPNLTSLNVEEGIEEMKEKTPNKCPACGHEF